MQKWMYEVSVFTPDGKVTRQILDFHKKSLPTHLDLEDPVAIFGFQHLINQWNEEELRDIVARPERPELARYYALTWHVSAAPEGG